MECWSTGVVAKWWLSFYNIPILITPELHDRRNQGLLATFDFTFYKVYRSCQKNGPLFKRFCLHPLISAFRI
jgi:hypothetical protein